MCFVSILISNSNRKLNSRFPICIPSIAACCGCLEIGIRERTLRCFPILYVSIPQAKVMYPLGARILLIDFLKLLGLTKKKIMKVKLKKKTKNVFKNNLTTDIYTHTHTKYLNAYYNLYTLYT